MSQHSNYELFEELGRGVNTVVYRSYDLSLGREVAIKELDESGRRDPRHRERFLREAQFLAQFEHDNVLRVYSVDTERGWIVMELMKGTLASIIAKGPSDPDLVRSVLKQTLEALAFLHEKNKVHGTVRPTNLLINEAGRVKLSEFEQTDSGGELRAPKGSKKYLAPELIRPEFGDFGPPLDLYCLAFTALELLKGPQFDGLFPGTGKGAIDADIAWLRWHSSPDELASTRKLVKGIPDDLCQVLDHMLKKRVADRPQSAQEVLKELADRPLIAVPIASATDEAAAGGGEKLLAPGVVRTLSEPAQQFVLPQRPSPDLAATGAATAASNVSTAPRSQTSGKSRAKLAATAGKPAAARFSKDWWNQQLSKPYVLYPLCAAILLGALWYSFFRKPGGATNEAKPLVAVTFDVTPDASGLEVVEGQKTLAPTKQGKYGLQPGPHSLTFRKDGYQPVTQDIEVSADAAKFAVKLEPVEKWVDVAVQVTPADAQLVIADKPQTLAQGTYSHKLKQGEPLALQASLDGYQPESLNLTADDLAELGNKVTINLERNPESAQVGLPASLAAKPGANVDPDLKLPLRALATKLGDSEPMEFALVKPGTYSFGAQSDGRRKSELPNRSVTIDQPLFIALHETTNAQYQKFFASAGESSAGTRWQQASAKWAQPLNLDAANNKLPVAGVSPQQAQAFCTWLGGRLPSEIEWESAVRGPQDEGFPYPWGNAEPTRERAKIFHGEAAGEGFGPVPVDQMVIGANSLGIAHALGNVAEWCQNSEQPGEYVLRGCSFTTGNINDVRVTWRGPGDATRGSQDAGFRVVVPVGPEPPTQPPRPAANDEVRSDAG